MLSMQSKHTLFQTNQKPNQMQSWLNRSYICTKSINPPLSSLKEYVFTVHDISFVLAVLIINLLLALLLSHRYFVQQLAITHLNLILGVTWLH